MNTNCPVCKNHPYEYVDVGIGMVPVAVNCCDFGYYYFGGYGPHRTPANLRYSALAAKIIKLRQSHSPRKKARAKRLLEAYFD